MAEKKINSRLINKHDVEVNWKKATNFIPLKGEIIVYDRDDNVAASLRGTYSYERFKIGDGETTVNNLPFASEAITAADIGIYVQDDEPTDAVNNDIWVNSIPGSIIETEVTSVVAGGTYTFKEDISHIDVDELSLYAVDLGGAYLLVDDNGSEDYENNAINFMNSVPFSLDANYDGGGTWSGTSWRGDPPTITFPTTAKFYTASGTGAELIDFFESAHITEYTVIIKVKKNNMWVDIGSVLDPTLTQEGAAADAKAVGDALAAIPAIPNTTTADNGKFLRVVNGVAEWATVTNAEGVRF